MLLNYAKNIMLTTLVAQIDSVYLAGDDDQAIYKWNGSDPKYFTTYFPGRKVVLHKTRRFNQSESFGTIRYSD